MKDCITTHYLDICRISFLFNETSVVKIALGCNQNRRRADDDDIVSREHGQISSKTVKLGVTMFLIKYLRVS